MPNGRPTPGPGASRRALITLTVAQALGLSGLPLVLLAAGIVGAELTPVEGLASLPLAAMVVGTALGAAPATLAIRRVGWRAGLAAGALLGLFGAVLGAIALALASFSALSLATMLVGGSLAFVMQYRFLAAELAGAEGAERAVAMVLSGGVVAGVVGPELGRAGQGLMATPWAGSFLGLAMVYALLAGLLMVGLGKGGGPAVVTADPRKPPPRASKRRAPGEGHGLVLAMAAGVTAYAVMTLLVTATPFAMRSAGFDSDSIARAIQGHVVAMYAPFIVSGRLMARFGARRFVVGGMAAMVTCVLLGLSAHGLDAWVVQLALLGLGWNALFLGGTVMLADSVRGAKGLRIQALNESLVFGSQALASIIAGALVAFGGWRAVNLVALGPIAVMALVLLAAVIRRMDRGDTYGHAHAPPQGGQHATRHHPRDSHPRNPVGLRSDE